MLKAIGFFKKAPITINIPWKALYNYNFGRACCVGVDYWKLERVDWISVRGKERKSTNSNEINERIKNLLGDGKFKIKL